MNYSDRASAGINSSFATTLPSPPPHFPITQKIKDFKIPLAILMEQLEKRNEEIGLESTDELKRITRIKACHKLISSTDEIDKEYKRKAMFDSVKEKKSKIIFLTFKIEVLTNR